MTLDGASATSGGNSKAASSNRYAMLANVAEDEDVEVSFSLGGGLRDGGLGDDEPS